MLTVTSDVGLCIEIIGPRSTKGQELRPRGQGGHKPRVIHGDVWAHLPPWGIASSADERDSMSGSLPVTNAQIRCVGSGVRDR